MRKRRPITQMRSVRLLGVCAALAGWSTLLWPAVRFYSSRPGVTLSSTLLELLKPTNSIFPDGVFVGWIFLLVGALLAVAVPLAALQILGALLRYVSLSEVEISILETRLTLRFEDAEMRRCTVTRQQLFHANQSGHGAYHYEHTTSSETGEVVGGSFDMASTLGDELLTSDFLIRRSKTRLEAIEMFKRPLPTSVFSTYLPDWLVLLAFQHTSLFDHVVVERVGEIQNLNEYNGDSPVFELTSVRYPASNVYITIDFPKDVAPAVSDVKCFRIKANVVSPIHPRCTPDGERRIFTAYVGRLEQERLRLQCSNARLHSVIGGQVSASTPAPLSAPLAPQPRQRRTSRLLLRLQALGRRGAPRIDQG